MSCANDQTPFGRVDVHAHYLPDFYRDAIGSAGNSLIDGMAIPGWSVDEHLALMDRIGIATAMLSVSSPGVHFGDDTAARQLAHQVNEAGRQAAQTHPDRFGLFGSLPYPDLDGAIEELDYCYDTLDVDGIVMLTHVGNTYLGDPVLEPLYEQLDRRHAKVFVHPTSPVCWEHLTFGRPAPMVEFLFDTSRTVVNLILSGTVARYPNIDYIIPHAGASLPTIADRVAAFTFVLTDLDPGIDVYHDLARLHYDLAGFPFPRQLDAILAITTAEHLHYGSDYPFTPEMAVTMLSQQLDQTGEEPGALDTQLLQNTRRLFPRLQ